MNLVVSNSMRFEGWEEVKERNERRKTGDEEVEEVYVVTDNGWIVVWFLEKPNRRFNSLFLN